MDAEIVPFMVEASKEVTYAVSFPWECIAWNALCRLVSNGDDLSTLSLYDSQDATKLHYCAAIFLINSRSSVSSSAATPGSSKSSRIFTL